MFGEAMIKACVTTIKYAIKIGKVLLKIILFCGGGWLLGFAALTLIIEAKVGTHVYDSKLYEVFFTVALVVCLILGLLTFIQNIMRMVKKDRSISIWKFIKHLGDKKGFEAKLGNDVVALRTSEDISGFVFGKKGDKYAVMPETTDGHILIIGGAGSGKTAGVLIPSLMSWKHRVFAIDIKGELYEKTKNARNKDKIKVFNPTDPSACGYDPFYMLREASDISSEARQLALAICPQSAETKDPFWIKSSQSMLCGFLIYYFEQGLSFSRAMRDIKSQPVAELIDEIMESECEKAKLEIVQFVGMNDKTLSGVFGEMSNHISVFATNEDLQRALSGDGDCITPADLENGYDIYCCIPEHKLEEWRDLLSMLVNQTLKFFERRKEGADEHILLAIDEFARCGKIETVANGLATLRSKHVHIALVVQSKSQLDAIYGKDIAEVIADNCSYKAILKANSPDTQEWCSKLVGTYDKKKVSSSYNADAFGIGKGAGTSATEEEKRIIKPEEFAYIKDVVFLAPNGYRRLKKANYYCDETFTRKL